MSSLLNYERMKTKADLWQNEKKEKEEQNAEEATRRCSPSLANEYENLRHLSQNGFFLVPPTCFMDVVDLLIVDVFTSLPNTKDGVKCSESSPLSLWEVNDAAQEEGVKAGTRSKEGSSQGNTQKKRKGNKNPPCLSCDKEESEMIKVNERENDIGDMSTILTREKMDVVKKLLLPCESFDFFLRPFGVEGGVESKKDHSLRTSALNRDASPSVPTAMETNSLSSLESAIQHKTDRMRENIKASRKRSRVADDKATDESECSYEEPLDSTADNKHAYSLSSVGKDCVCAHEMSVKWRRARVVPALKRALYLCGALFTSDMEFLKVSEIGFFVQHAILRFDNLFSSNHTSLLTAYSIDIFLHIFPILSGLSEVIFYHTQCCVERVPSSYHAPRLVRFSNELQLSAKEAKAILYLAVVQSGSSLSLIVKYPTHPSWVSFFSQMNSAEFHHFIREDRQHIEQGSILLVDEAFSMESSRILLAKEVAAAISGAEMSSEQLAKLEKTGMKNVLEAEVNASRHLCAVLGKTLKKTSCRSHTVKHILSEVGKDESEIESEDEEVECDSTNENDNVPIIHKSDSCSLDTAHDETAEDGNKKKKNEGKKDDEKKAGDDESKSIEEECPYRYSSPEVNVASAVTDDKRHVPYNTNCECMEVAFYILTLMIKIRNVSSDIKEEEDCSRRSRDEALARGMVAKMRVAQEVHSSRIRATVAEGKFIPEIEALASRFHLSELEKNVLLFLVGNSISHDVLVAINGRYFLREGQRQITVGYIIFVLCNGLQHRVKAREVFLQSSPLLSHSIISLAPPDNSAFGDIPRNSFNVDLMNYICDIDRKIVDLLMGKTVDSREMVPGSTVITPSVCLEKVVLPRATMEKVFSRLEHFSLVNECKRQCNFGDGLGESTGGLVILFYGPSGTGKTMLAHAVAHELKKKLLLVSLVAFKHSQNAPEMLKFIFREAKLTEAIIFFDECECIFSSRAENSLLTTLLVEFEKYDGVMLMATNAAHSFDESMNRRISLMVEFKPPDHSMRHQIWRSHLPSKLALASDVSLEQLALNYELTGGLIRNAVLAAISSAVARDNTSTPTINMADLELGAKQQLRGFFMTTTENSTGTSSGQKAYFTPKRRLEELIMDSETKQKLDYVVKLSKSRSTLFSLWGFTEENAADQGSIYLFYGPSGTGKSLAAEGIAYECGVTIRMCNATALVSQNCQAVGKGEGMTAVFEEALQLGAMIVIEEAQIFFQHSVEEDAMRVLLYHALRHPKPVILIATATQYSSFDTFTYNLPITLSIAFKLPRRVEREKIWRHVFPTSVPLDKDMNWNILSAIELSPREIERIAFRSCCRAAFLPEKDREVSMEVIQEELEKERKRQHAGNLALKMYA